MAVPAVTLGKPYMLVTKSGSSSGLSARTGDFVFGTVQKVYSTCERFSVNDTVLFNPTQSQVITDGTTDYYLVSDAIVAFKDAGGAP